ncbi:alkaline shock response membrane anchor protein AmaP [Desulfovirgula thermocuniculi]|uniref:alkaline shock response membrane anchor protein AmaP n=1 Tax=Desulfovirgula thermocuniculi TaxID=348842 RepID=UPI0003F744C5|nr:alkaline shock response membrane anchor protein AmaP [Desulfovirgula thermocuniculi]
MGPFDRGLLACYALAVTLGLGVLAAGLAGALPPYLLWAWLRAGLEEPEIPLLVLGAMMLVGARLFWAAVRVRRPRVVVQEAAMGQVRIALAAIKELAEKLALAQGGVREAAARVEQGKSGIRILLELAVTSDVNVPAVAAGVQEAVSNRIKEVTGVVVEDLVVTVKSFSARRPRVE